NAGHYLALEQEPNGRYRYLVNPSRSERLPGYDNVRHGGTAFYLFLMLRAVDDPVIRSAAERGLYYLLNQIRDPCVPGEDCACFYDSPKPSLGATALAMVTMAEAR